MDSLLSRARDLLDGNDNSKFVQEVQGKFGQLEDLVNERHGHCKFLVEKWKAIQKRKVKLKAIMKSALWLSGSKKISSIGDLASCSNECQVSFFICLSSYEEINLFKFQRKMKYHVF